MYGDPWGRALPLTPWTLFPRAICTNAGSQERTAPFCPGTEGQVLGPAMATKQDQRGEGRDGPRQEAFRNSIFGRASASLAGPLRY